MSDPHTQIKYPKWVMDRKGVARTQAQLQFCLRYAAICATESGSLQQLAEALGVTRGVVYKFFGNTPAEMSPKMAIHIEKLIGPDLISRRDLAPHFFE